MGMVAGIVSSLSGTLHTLREFCLPNTNIHFDRFQICSLSKEANCNVCAVMPKWYQKSTRNSHTILYIKQAHSSTSHLSGSAFDPSGIHSTQYHVHKLLTDKKTCEMVVQKSSAPWQAAIRPDDSVCSVIMSQVRRQPPFVPKPPSSTASKDDEWPHYM